jgi:methionyl-tRNA formyltransferase
MKGVVVGLTRQFSDRSLQPVPQNHSSDTFCNRHTPGDSEITAAELARKPGKYLYSKFRPWTDHCPNALIQTTGDENRVIRAAHLEEGV